MGDVRDIPENQLDEFLDEPIDVNAGGYDGTLVRRGNGFGVRVPGEGVYPIFSGDIVQTKGGVRINVTDAL